MPRWLLKLKGDIADLEELPHWFPAGDPFAFSEEGNFFLSSPKLDVLEDAVQVNTVGRAILEEASAIVSILWPALIAPTIENIVREADDGSRHTHHVLMPVCASMRVKSGRRKGASLKKGMTDAQWFQSIANASASLRTALLLWADPNRTWPRLYRVLEEVEEHLGSDADKAGLCSFAERKQFMRSANTAAVAGKDSRHADGKYQAPPNPMTIEEATSFIRSVIQSCLKDEARNRHGVALYLPKDGP